MSVEIQAVGVFLLKATVVLATGLGVAAALRRSPAGTRHAVWLTTVAGVLALPLVAGLTPLRLQVLPDMPAPAAHHSEAPGGLPLAQRSAEATVPAPPPSSTPAAAVPYAASRTWPRPTAIQAAAFLWAAVALALLGRVAVGLLAVRRIVRTARPLNGRAWNGVLCDAADRLGLAEVPALVTSDRVDMPFASGLWRGTIVLPAAAEAWSDERRRLVLFHELAHMRRRDLAGHLLGRLACALYWFHPLVWTVARRLRAESEKACDDLVLASGTRPSDYAGHLLEILTSARRTGALSAAVAMARRSEFEGRMLAILDPAAPRVMMGRVRSVALTGALALVFVGVAALAPSETRPRPTNAATARQATVEAVAVKAAVRRQPPQPSQASPSNPAQRSQRQARQQDAEEQRGSERFEEDEDTEETEEEDAPMPAEQAAVLARVLKTDSDANVRRSAAWALATSGNASAADALTAALKTDADGEVREMAAWGLSEVKGDAVTAALAAALQADKDDEVRAVSAWGLAYRTGSNTAALEAAAADRSAHVRESAIWALGNRGLQKAPAAVVTALRDAEAPVRQVAAWTIGQTGDAAAAAALTAAFKDEKDDEVRRSLFHALVLVGERSPEVIESVLESKDPELRAHAVRMLSRNRGPWPWPWPRPDPRPMP